jgi:hypothetical protein
VPEKPRQAITLVVGSTEVYLPLEGLVDLAAERARLARELAEHERLIQKSEALLGSGFAEKAPPAVVEKERTKLGACRTPARSYPAVCRKSPSPRPLTADSSWHATLGRDWVLEITHFENSAGTGGHRRGRRGSVPRAARLYGRALRRQHSRRRHCAR